MTKYDFAIIGAGVIGLSVAREVKRRFPSSTVAVIEKESHLGMHASGRNSGVLHCGIYYDSDTIKAKVCSLGAARMMAFAEEKGIAYRKTGKVILATAENQLPSVERLICNARENGIQARQIDSNELRELEPACAPGVAAIHCPGTAIIDSLAVLSSLRQELVQHGVDFIFGTEVRGLARDNTLLTTSVPISFGYVFNCAGAYADAIAHTFGVGREYALIPFKGIYWKLTPKASSLIRANIYPVPDPSLPFLGIHITRVINGEVYIGPTAIPAIGRENYGVIQGARLGEGFKTGLKLAGLYFSNQNNFRLLAHTEIAKYSKRYFLRAAKGLCSSLTEEDMVRTPKVGIRPQLINIKSRKLEMDYIIERTENSLHVLNAISPAFTSSIVLAELIVDKCSIAGTHGNVAA